MRAASLISIGLVCAAVAPAAHADDPDVLKATPLAAAFGAAPLISSPQLSPDGERLVQIQVHPSGLSVARVLDITTGDVTALVAGTRDDAQVQREPTWCGWKSDTRLVCGFRALGASTVSRMVGVDRDGGNLEWFPRQRLSRRTILPVPFPYRIVSWLPDDPEHVLALVSNTNGAGYGVARLNVHDGIVTDENQGAIQIFNWIADGDGEPRLYRRIFGNEISWHVRDAGSPSWSLLHEKTVDDPDDPFTPAGFGEHRNELLVFDDHEGRRALFAIDLEQNLSRRVLYAHESLDVDTVHPLGKYKRFVAVSYIDDRPRYEFLDARIAKVHAELQAYFPRKNVTLVDEDWNRRYYLVLVDAADDPGTYFRFDSERNTLLSLLPAYPTLAGRELTPVEKVGYPAADGTLIPAYLTMPKDGAYELPRAVVLPHDGPLSRDYLKFDFLAQYLAANGYAVLQANYRGSSGYGDDWEGRGGYRDWRLAVSDIAAGAEYLAREGIADRKRICTVGWGYGGYAALMSVIENPGLYRCVVSIGGVTDPRSHGAAERAYWWAGQARRAFIGTDAAELAAGSPLERVDEIGVPVLLFHGDRSTETFPEQSAQLARALEREGKVAELVTYEDAEHEIRQERYRIDLLARLAEFLDAHVLK